MNPWLVKGVRTSFCAGFGRPATTSFTTRTLYLGSKQPHQGLDSKDDRSSSASSACRYIPVVARLAQPISRWMAWGLVLLANDSRALFQQRETTLPSLDMESPQVLPGSGNRPYLIGL